MRRAREEQPGHARRYVIRACGTSPVLLQGPEIEEQHGHTLVGALGIAVPAAEEERGSWVGAGGRMPMREHGAGSSGCGRVLPKKYVVLCRL